MKCGVRFFSGVSNDMELRMIALEVQDPAAGQELNPPSL
jgi:hypothetical protein